MPRIGILFYSSWSNPRYFIPRPLLTDYSVKERGYQQYRWLRFYIIIPMYQKAFNRS